MKKLGKTQEAFLKSFQRNGGIFQFGGGWIWGSRSQTQKLLDGLIERGLVFKKTYQGKRESYDMYYLTDLGKGYLVISE